MTAADGHESDDLSGDELVRVLAALANPHRVRILAMLAERRVHVSQLARDVGLSRPLVHMHLRKLEDAGLVSGQLELSQEGKAMKYFEVSPFTLRLTPELIAEAARTLSPVDGPESDAKEETR